MRPTVALCVIAKNEENNVKQWYDSISGCFDEIHFVDTGSTDNTVAIAESLGCTVHHFKWVDDFSAARNFAFSKATTDFIMWNDLDDVLSSKTDFLHFRDKVMNTGDYWLATYHYASGSDGKPLCSFARERVFRRDKGFKWTHFIHEGVVPVTNDGECRIQFIPEWTMVHKRTTEDLNKDRSRNLRIFELNADKMNERLRFYYGKELFENGRHLDAYIQLKKAISSKELEGHDLILAYQYAAHSAKMCNDTDAAIALCMEGIKFVPDRAEYYAILGDCYISKGNHNAAIPCYNAARSCKNHTPSGGRVSGPIFVQDDVYGPYPTNMLAKIYAQTGDLTKAIEEAEVSWKKHGNKEGKEILDQLLKIEIAKVKAKKPTEDIVFTCWQSPYEWDADIAKKQAMGGSETACIEMAKAIKKLSGRPVKIFNNPRGDTKVIDGVEYISANHMTKWFEENEPHKHIAWRHNIATDMCRYEKTYVWAHDLTTPAIEAHDKYNKLLCLTEFHKDYAMSMQGIPEDKIIVTRNGIDPKRFESHAAPKNPRRIAFTSSPDRGLDRAMLICDMVKEVYPDIELHVYYGYEHLHKYGKQALADKLARMIKERPYVRYHGATQQDVLAEHLKETAIWLYPSDWIETSCITAMEMLCAGVYPIVRDLGGVACTLAKAREQGMCDLIYTECTTEAHRKLFANAIISALQEEKWTKVKVDPATYSWENVAREWLEWL